MSILTYDNMHLGCSAGSSGRLGIQYIFTLVCLQSVIPAACLLLEPKESKTYKSSTCHIKISNLDRGIICIHCHTKHFVIPLFEDRPMLTTCLNERHMHSHPRGLDFKAVMVAHFV